MMDLLHTLSSPNGYRPLSPAAALPRDPLYSELLEALPRGEGGFSSVCIRETVPEALKVRLSREYGTAFSESPEAFILAAEGDTLEICSGSRRGILYALYALIQSAREEGIPQGFYYDTPKCSYRGLKLYMPGPRAEDIAEFKRIIDMAVCYRHNSIMLEVGGAMEYKRHPEINRAWVTYAAEMKRYPARAEEVQRGNPWEKNSIHFENGDGSFLSQEQVRELVAYCRERDLEVIPEVPTLSHTDYILNAYPELAERRDDPFPDTYCPSDPAVYPIVFDILDEVLEVFHPKTVNIGHDEFYSFCLCSRCRDRDPAEVYAADVTKIHDYLKARGVETMLWPEKLLNVFDKKGESYGGAERHTTYPGGERVVIPATYRAIDLIPKDVWCHHWYWELREELEGEFLRRNFKTSFGNFSPQKIPHWTERTAAGIIGGATSGWTHARFQNFQRDAILLDLVFGCFLNWGKSYDDGDWEALLPIFFRELYHYHYRRLLKKPHLLLTHNTTVQRPWTYLTSTFVEDTPIGRYRIRYESGYTFEVPLFYGVNITNRSRFWDRTLDDAFDIYLPDNLLIEVSYTTLPVRCPDGTTAFVLPVADPHPEEAIVSVEVIKETEEPGSIYLIGLEREPGTAFTPVQAGYDRIERQKACIDG